MIEERCELAQQGLPLSPVLLRCEEIVLHIAQELDLHDMHLSDVDAGYLCPRLVRIRVVVQKFIAQHQGHSEQSVLTARLSPYCRIQFLQSIDEQQCQYDHILCNAGSREYRGNPFSKSSCRLSIGSE